MLWQLVAARGGTPKERVTQFPIAEHKSTFDSAEERGAIKGVTADDRTIIERAQPYHHGPHWSKRHLLFLLRELNNIDKHRFLHVGFLAIAQRIGPGEISVPSYPGIYDLARNLPPDGTDTSLISPLGWEHLPIWVSDCGTQPVREISLTAGRNRDDPAEILREHLRNPGPAR